MSGQRSDGHSIRSPLIILIEVETSRGEETKFIVEGEIEFVVCQWKIIGLRTGTVHFRGIELTKTKDQRMMVGGLMIVDEESIETRIGEI